MILESAIYLTLEFSSTKNQHKASCFLTSFSFVFVFLFVLFCISHPTLCSFLFMRPSAVQGVLGKLSHTIGQKTLAYFFLATGIEEEEHTGPWMVSQLIGVSCLTDLASGLIKYITLVSHNTCFSSSSQNQGRRA